MRIKNLWVVCGLVMVFAGSILPARAARLADGTPVKVRLTADLASSKVMIATRVDMEVAQPVTLQGVVAIPAGAVAWGAVQVVKPGKTLYFDIEGVRLPNQEIVKLRCSPNKTTHTAKDEIKVETTLGGEVGAAKGNEYTAYLDQDVNVPAAPAPSPQPAAPALAPAHVTPAAPVAAPTPQPTPQPPAPVVKPAPVPAPVVSTPVAPPTPAAPSALHPAAPAQPGDYITVECFSEPMGADIMIDDEFHGSTPSILKIQPGNHRIEYRLMGYTPHSQNLNLVSGTGLRTVRMTLEKQP